MFRILSIDGGGLRGYIPLLIIRDLEARLGKSIHECFDLIAGTSTGGIIACGVTYAENLIDRSYSTEDLLKLYREDGGKIFPPFVSKKLPWTPLADLKRNKHDSAGLRHVLAQKFKDDHLDKCLTPVLIPAYDIRIGSPLLFSSRLASHEAVADRRNPRIADVLLATSAAPTYLPSHTFVGLDGTGANKNIITAVDGGIYANNPSLFAIHEALSSKPDGRRNHKKIRLKDICLLSIGTGHHMIDYAKEATNEWGVYQWGPRIFDLMTYASSQTVDMILSTTLLRNKNYLRVNININESNFSEMDVHQVACYPYWEKEVNDQLLMNDGYIKTINDFIDHAELVRL